MGGSRSLAHSSWARQISLDEALAHAYRAHDIARRLGDHDLETLALSCRGLTLVFKGELDAGMAALDEASLVAMAGGLEPQTAGGVCCTSIGACTALGDWSRVAQWTEAQDRWCKREHINGFPGDVPRLPRRVQAPDRRLAGGRGRGPPGDGGVGRIHSCGRRTRALRDRHDPAGPWRSARGRGRTDPGARLQPRPGAGALAAPACAGQGRSRQRLHPTGPRRTAARHSHTGRRREARSTGSRCSRRRWRSPSKRETSAVARTAADELAALAERFDTIAVRAAAATSLGAVAARRR